MVGLHFFSPVDIMRLLEVMRGKTTAHCVFVGEAFAAPKGSTPLGRFLGFAVAGCEPDEMGIGPVLAMPKVLGRLGLKVADIVLWQLNEAFAVQVLY